MSIQIRPIEAADNTAIAAVIRQTLTDFGAAKPGTVYFDPTTDQLFELFQTPNSAYFVAHDEKNAILGGAGIFPTEGLPEGVCELVKVYVSSAARGKGLGKQLILEALEMAKTLHFKQIYLETMPELHIAVPLYERLGFRYLTGSLGNSGHFGCDVWMLRDL